MEEFEEGVKNLTSLIEKLENLGDSLWHKKHWKGIKRIRKTNYGWWLLEWCKTI